MEGAYYQEPTPLTLRERLARWLFPFPSSPPHSDRLERLVGPTYVVTVVRVHVDLADRLRLLWSGRCEVQVRTYTDKLIDNAESTSSFAVLR